VIVYTWDELWLWLRLLLLGPGPDSTIPPMGVFFVIVPPWQWSLQWGSVVWAVGSGGSGIMEQLGSRQLRSWDGDTVGKWTVVVVQYGH
jgi:hypothetical protein